MLSRIRCDWHAVPGTALARWVFHAIVPCWHDKNPLMPCLAATSAQRVGKDGIVSDSHRIRLDITFYHILPHFPSNANSDVVDCESNSDRSNSDLYLDIRLIWVIAISKCTFVL